ncbi:MAG TPA: hypothetical protein VFF40_03595 [Acidimicrobiia bacterium]|nr:hypothetical protein [Acidimicrobiia bacterium]
MTSDDLSQSAATPPRRHPHRLRNLTVVGVVVALTLATGVYVVWDRFLRNNETPVDVAAVEDDFSGRGEGSAEAGTPKAGVYLYRTTGSESVSALGGTSADYPATTTLTVTESTCGVDTRRDVLEGRYDESKLCRQANGTWVLTETVTSDRFFNQTEADTYTCPDVVNLPADPKPNQSWKGTCTDAPNTTTMRYRVIGTETVRVDGEPVSTVRLRVTSTEGGERAGGGVEHRWVQPGTNLVVKARSAERDTSPSPIGRVTYQQQYEIALKSLDPKR